MDANQRGNSKAAQMIWIVGPPVIFCIGVVGNILSIIVLTNRQNRKTSTAIFLTFLACADLMIIVVALPRWWMIYAFGFDIRKTSNFVCKVHWYLVYFCTNYSALMLTIVTLERVISTVLPYKVKMLCNKKVAVVSSVVVAVLWAGMVSHIFYGFGLFGVPIKVSDDRNASDHDEMNITDQIIFELPETTNFTNSSTEIKLQYQCLWTEKKSYLEFYNYTFEPIYSTLYQIIPQCVFFFGSIIIIRTLVKTRSVASSYGPKGTQTKKQKRLKSQTTQITVTLLVVNAVFFFCTIPVRIFLFGRKYWIDLNTGMTELQEILWAVFNLLFYINHAINFILYFLSGSKFRNEVMYLFRCGHQDAQSEHSHSMSNIAFVTNRKSTAELSAYTDTAKVMEVD